MNNIQTCKTKVSNKHKRTTFEGRPWVLLVMMTCLFGLSACGNKGDLYLPNETATEEATEQDLENPEQAIE